MITPQQRNGIIRHIVTAVGGILVTLGVTDDGTAEQISGVLMMVIAAVWSVVSKRQSTGASGAQTNEEKELMKRRMENLVFVVALCGTLAASGCASLDKAKALTAAPGGVLGLVQSADEKLAAKYGVPVSVVKTVRSALGIPDVRTLPDSSRVLPAGWQWSYDLLDAEGRVVDASQFHWGETPRLRKAGTLEPSVFVKAPSAPAPASVETLDGVLSALATATQATASASNTIQTLGERLP